MIWNIKDQRHMQISLYGPAMIWNIKDQRHMQISLYGPCGGKLMRQKIVDHCITCHQNQVHATTTTCKSNTLMSP